MLSLWESNTIITDTKAVLLRLNSLETFNIANASFNKVFDGLLDATRDALIKSGHIAQRCLGPFDLH